MIVRNIPNFGSFGAISPITQGNCDATGSWENWCDCMWPAVADASTNSKCRSKPWWVAGVPPWTVIGAAARGIPGPNLWQAAQQVATDIGSQLPPPSSGPVATPTSGEVEEVGPSEPKPPGILGVPGQAAMVGGLILVGGVVAFYLKNKNKGGGKGKRR